MARELRPIGVSAGTAWRPGARDDDRLGARSSWPPDPTVFALTGVADIHRNPDWVFRRLHEPENLIRCVPGGRLTRLIDSRTFEAQIDVGIGPFKLGYTGVGRIVASDPRSRTARLTLSGISPSHVPPLKVSMSMAVHGHRGGSRILMAFQVAIADHGGFVGRAWIEPIARDMLERTIHQIKEQLEGSDPGPAAA
jgi:carbon monoxide dehydrogenase subunit G